MQNWNNIFKYNTNINRLNAIRVGAIRAARRSSRRASTVASTATSSSTRAPPRQGFLARMLAPNRFERRQAYAVLGGGVLRLFASRSDAVSQRGAVLKLPLHIGDVQLSTYDARRPPPNATSTAALLRSLITGGGGGGGDDDDESGGSSAGGVDAAFQLVFENGASTRSFVFRASSAKECQQWLEALRQHKRVVDAAIG